MPVNLKGSARAAAAASEFESLTPVMTRTTCNRRRRVRRDSDCPSSQAGPFAAAAPRRPDWALPGPAMLPPRITVEALTQTTGAAQSAAARHGD